MTSEAHSPPRLLWDLRTLKYMWRSIDYPKEGKTISAKIGQTLVGGKGANQAACGAKQLYPTYFVGRLGEDAHGKLITGALGDGSNGCGVHLDYVRSTHAIVMQQSDGQDSIIIVGGANRSGWPEKMSYVDLEIVRNAGIVLLQRETPDSIIIQVVKQIN